MRQKSRGGKRERDNLPGLALELVASSIGDLLVGAAKLVGVNFVTANLLLDGIESWYRVLALFDLFTLYPGERTLVEVVFLLAAGTGAAAGVAAGAAAAAELGCETGEFVHDGDIQVKDIPSQSVSSKVYRVGGGIRMR